MLCQKCQQKPATVFFTQTVGAKTSQAHLCEDCAREQMKAQGALSPFLGNPFAAMSDFFNQFMAGAPIPAPAGAPVVPEPSAQCPACGYPLSAFRQNGRLGCPRCYEAFASFLEPLVAGIHGNVRHAEEEAPPAATAVPEDRTVQEARLREQMRAAIEKEKFEEAARLRDEIQKLQEPPHV